jgi:hypothetical protein
LPFKCNLQRYSEGGEAGLLRRLENGKHTMQVKYSQFSAEMGLMRRPGADVTDAERDDALSTLRAVPMANAAATETVAQAPGWLASGWIEGFGGDREETGAWGYWNARKDEVGGCCLFCFTSYSLEYVLKDFTPK